MMVMRISLQGQKGLTRIILSMALIFLCFMGRIESTAEVSEQTAVEVVDEPAHYSSASISDEAIKAGNETATMKNMDDLKELMQKFLPGDRVRVTHSIWPKNLNNVLKSGEESELLLLLRNDWFQNITVFSLSPSFRDPKDLNIVLRNITTNRIFLELPPGEEVTLSYRIRPEMDPVTEKQRWYRAPGFSGIINIVESVEASSLDWKGIFMYATSGIIAITCIPLVAKAFFGKNLSFLPF